jgi:hypothetical protein
MQNKIRKISIGAEVKSQFHYILNGAFPVPIDGKISQKTISEFVETETGYEIYLKSGTEVQLWKTIPKNDITTIEFEID